jgi:N-acetylneuraminic acid mutarotase
MRETIYKLALSGVLALQACCVCAQTRGELRRFIWKDGPALPVSQGLSAGFAGFVSGRLLYAGGSNFDRPLWSNGKKQFHRAVFALEFGRKRSGSWRQVGELPEDVADGASVDTPKGLLCIGGTDGTTVLSDVVLLRWNTRHSGIEQVRFPPLPEPSSDAAAARVGSRVYVMGGKRADGKALHTVWMLDLRHPGAWRQASGWPGAARYGASLTPQYRNGREYLYLMSGKSDSTYLTDGYRFDPSDESWKPISSMPRAALLAPAMAVEGNSILIFSGSDGHDPEKIRAIRSVDGYHFHPDVLSYQTATDTWTRVAEMPRGRVGCRALLHGHDVWIAGGEIAPSVRTPQVLIWTRKK